MKIIEENEGAPQGVKLERYTEYQAEKRLRDIKLSKYTPTQEKRRKRDMKLYQEYVSWASTNAAPGNIVRYLMRKYSFKSRVSVYYTVERGKRILAEMQNNENE